MSLVLINPNLVAQANDPFTTGIVYMPISLAYAATAFEKAGMDVVVVDAFGEAPRKVRLQGKFWLFGLTAAEIVSRIPSRATIAVVYAINLTNHISTINIITSLKKNCKHLKIIVLENTQAVTAYALRHVAKEFFDAGADYIATGEPELCLLPLIEALTGAGQQGLIKGMAGIIGKNFSNPVKGVIEDLNALGFPAWEKFPLANYWSLRFAHGPLSGQKYLPLLTSRGCPYPCQFCVVPATNNQKWRARSAMHVVDEIEHWHTCLGITEFHIEDLDPTISDERIRQICQELIRRKLCVVWKIVAGTKVETIRSEETIDLMAQAGCRYISISPETGSPRLLKLMRKPFDLAHAVKLVKRMNEVGIRSQACFVLGYPTETKEDLKLTQHLVWQLTREGIDEIALFIITPVPGSAIADQFKGYTSLSELNFTPTWRADYQVLNRFRLKLYAIFLFWKLIYYPFKIVRQACNFFKRNFETKMEMVPYRAMMLKKWAHGAV